MSENEHSDTNQRDDEKVDETQPAPAAASPSEREQSTTVGTGSYVAVSCAVMMLLLTGVLAAILLLTRWLS